MPLLVWRPGFTVNRKGPGRQILYHGALWAADTGLKTAYLTLPFCGSAGCKACANICR